MIGLDSRFLVGSYPPIITPFKAGKIDYETYASLLEFQIREGTHGVVVNGTTAEPSTLTIEERNELVKTAVEVVRRRIPVVAATGSQSHAETLQLTEYAAKIGADALLIVTPYYVRPPQRGLVAYYNDLGERTSLPFMIYHIPGRAAVSVELSTLEQIAEHNENFVGIKHAAADLPFVTDVLQRFGPDFRVFVGLEEYTFPMMALGATGTMNAVANLVPRRIAALADETLAGNMAIARKLHFELSGLNRAVFFDTNPISIKYMMKRLGIIRTNAHRLPMMPATPELERRLDETLRGADLL
jgi:4-hydroxy-tetrahydrodipicolinate synthase